jgi:type I restriction enzyme S subunit
MVGEWRKVRFGEVAEILPGKYIPASDYDAAGAYVVYGSNSIMGRVHIPLYEGPIIAFARIGSNCGATMYSAAPCWINNNAAGIRAKAGCDTRFIYYWMQSCDFSQIREGSGQPYISDRTLKELVLLLPPLPEQRAIAHILGTLDDKIELNRRMSETLEAMARALFKAWFVDFEPVRAKMEGRWQRGQSLPGLPAHLYDLFPDRLVDSELGPIPEGWKVGTLADLAVLNPEVWKTETRPAKIIYVDLSNTKWGRIDSLTAYDSADAPSRAQRVLRPGDTIVGTVRPGNGSYAFIAEGGLTGSTGFAVLRPRAAHYAEVVYLAATAPDNIDRLAHLADGAAYPAVRPEVVAATPVVCPGDEVLARFSQAAGPALAKIAQNERASRTLAALRDALLPKLIRGEIRVKDAERFLKVRGL